MERLKKASQNNKLGSRNFYLKQKLIKKENNENESLVVQNVPNVSNASQNNEGENWAFTKCNVVYVECANGEPYNEDGSEIPNDTENVDMPLESGMSGDECGQNNSNEVDADAPLTKADLMDFCQSLCTHIDKKIAEVKQPLVNRLINLDAKVLNIQKDVDDLKTYVMEKRALKENENIISLKKLIEIYQLSLPLKSLEDFEKFDETIVDARYNDMKTHFISTVNTNNDLLKICTGIFKTFFTRDVVVRFTAQKKIKDKKVFKTTKFYDCLKESLFHAFSRVKVIDDSALLHTIGSVINNAIDWEGHRTKRLKLEQVSDQ